jgi:nucleoside-diphosphate-sugar epimerase
MKTLVIGGSGYIGSALVAKLGAASVDIKWFGGPEPTIIANYSSLPADFYSNYDCIVLLAAHSSMAMCAGNYASAWQNNVTALSGLISKLTESQLLIYASSGSVYGNGGLDRQESMTLATAQIEYDLTKQIGEQVAYGAKCKTVGLRFGTLSGYNSVARSDLMLNAMTISAKNNSEINCYNGTNHRSILGIDDCVRAICAIIAQPELSDQHDIFNLSSFGGSIDSFATVAGSILNVPVIRHPEITNNFSFELNSSKFERRYNFHFEDTAESIITSILENYDSIIWSPRTEKIKYV